MYLAKRPSNFFTLVFKRFVKAGDFSQSTIGEKQLYYGWVNEQFVFASELKSNFSSLCREKKYCIKMMPVVL